MLPSGAPLEPDDFRPADAARGAPKIDEQRSTVDERGEVDVGVGGDKNNGVGVEYVLEGRRVEAELGEGRHEAVVVAEDGLAVTEELHDPQGRGLAGVADASL